uniref:Putative DNA binding, helix-turn-helix domain containing protein n=1 Tax=viral metagenome TaxID=1070528 RepID=A0A6H1ZUT4_9ZZZZ
MYILLNKDFMPVKLIAREYDITGDTVYKWLKKWGIRKRSGIRYLLGKMILEGD